MIGGDWWCLAPEASCVFVGFRHLATLKNVADLNTYNIKRRNRLDCAGEDRCNAFLRILHPPVCPSLLRILHPPVFPCLLHTPSFLEVCASNFLLCLPLCTACYFVTVMELFWKCHVSKYNIPGKGFPVRWRRHSL